ncbi:MAG: energy-coupling factor transporter transmembrane component T [Acidobacteriota bacterium]
MSSSAPASTAPGAGSSGSSGVAAASSFHTLSWVVWLLFALSLAAMTRNGWYLTQLLLCAYLARRILAGNSSSARAWGVFLRFGIFLALLGLLLALLFGGNGRTVLVELPRLHWTITVAGESATLLDLGGPVTLESLLWAASGAFSLITVLVILATFNILVDHYQLVRRVPAVLDRAATVASIGLAFVPEMVRAQGELREGMALRGYTGRSLRDLGPLFIALLQEGLERSIALAEAMEARGYARRGASWSRGRELLVRGGLLAGLALALAGAVGLRGIGSWGVEGSQRLAAGVALGVGLALLALTLASIRRGVRRSAYRRESWRWQDTVLASVSGAGLGIAVFLWWNQRVLFYYTPFPTASWPPWSPAIALLMALPILPALLGWWSRREHRRRDQLLQTARTAARTVARKGEQR